MAASSYEQPWAFDVASLMVLVNEREEENYRLSQPFFLQCLVMLPVVGLQNYVRSYDFLTDTSNLEYFSAGGVKTAPLRYMRLYHAIKNKKLLHDSTYTVFHTPKPPIQENNQGLGLGQYEYLNAPAGGNPPFWHGNIILWVLFTWIAFAGLLMFTIMVPSATWIGVANCAAFTAWSIILRLVEKVNIQTARIVKDKVTNPKVETGVFILGRNNSAFVLEGPRIDIKHWTAQGLSYKDASLGLPAWVWQSFTRLGSLLMLLFIFSSIPNGSTIDQVAFVILNGLAQVNVLVGQRMISEYCISRLTEKGATLKPDTRTDLYGLLIHRYKDYEATKAWIGASGMLPQTPAWEEWKSRVLRGHFPDIEDTVPDFHGLYERIVQGEGTGLQVS